MDWSFLHLTAANYVVITHNFWILNDQLKAFAFVVRIGGYKVCHPSLQIADSAGYTNHPSNLHQHANVATMKVLHSLMRL